VAGSEENKHYEIADEVLENIFLESVQNLFLEKDIVRKIEDRIRQKTIQILEVFPDVDFDWLLYAFEQDDEEAVIEALGKEPSQEEFDFLVQQLDSINALNFLRQMALEREKRVKK